VNEANTGTFNGPYFKGIQQNLMALFNDEHGLPAYVACDSLALHCAYRSGSILV
jgi:hypothetical protein